MNTVTLDIPEPDHEGFESFIKDKYTKNRWSDIKVRKDKKTGGKIIVRSGEHPVYDRFIKDLSPKLHKHGFVISSATKDAFDGVEDEEVQRCHQITAIPLLWVAAYVNGYICKRAACRNIIADAVSPYCSTCDSAGKRDSFTIEKDALRMIHP